MADLDLAALRRLADDDMKRVIGFWSLVAFCVGFILWVMKT